MQESNNGRRDKEKGGKTEGAKSEDGNYGSEGESKIKRTAEKGGRIRSQTFAHLLSPIPNPTGESLAALLVTQRGYTPLLSALWCCLWGSEVANRGDR